MTKPWQPTAVMVVVGLASSLLCAGIAEAGPCAPAAPEIVSVTFATQSASALEDGFEDNQLSRHWSLKHILAKSYAYTDKIVREGRQQGGPWPRLRR